ncbi:hypothetical protein Mal15_55550 [Stieleria maiorica]|uniref:Uncharacterized protein n=1 Tax=Stieleria maiorica TaxID=2795974 RepID=A0A5B9MR17_9BACT|nr:cupin domain-containing protein [Stieleria maiorica]QEG01478.1 hypothetical protein Mal15_55550 [Stieleria maiorica]
MFPQHSFTVLNDPSSVSCWSATLSRLFQRCRELTAQLNAEIRAGRLAKQTCIKGNLSESVSESKSFLRDLLSLDRDYDIDLLSPFEGVAQISGGVWYAGQLFGKTRDDAVLKLHFQPGVNDLPVHSHDFSDRVIIVVGGKGVFKVACQAHSNPNDTVMRDVEVGLGDVLAFSRGVKHTFQTSRDDLQLFSYHAPFIRLDDPRQFTIDSAENRLKTLGGSRVSFDSAGAAP